MLVGGTHGCTRAGKPQVHPPAARARARYASAMYVSTPTGKCGPCCSTAATLCNTAYTRRPNSSVVSFSQSVTRCSSASPMSCHWPILRATLKPSSSMSCTLARSALAGLFITAPAHAQTLTRSGTMGGAFTWWFYQAVADGEKKYGLDVTIVPGGPQVNNRMLLLAGKIEFFMSAKSPEKSFDAVAQQHRPSRRQLGPQPRNSSAKRSGSCRWCARPQRRFRTFLGRRCICLHVDRAGRTCHRSWRAGRRVVGAADSRRQTGHRDSRSRFSSQ